MEAGILKKPVRTISGVTPLTVGQGSAIMEHVFIVLAENSFPKVIPTKAPQ